jgi:hypothetical protein
MKWYKHDSSSLYDPTQRTLGDKVGPVGMWIYWGIITYISRHGENFQVKIENVAEELREDPENLLSDSTEVREDSGESREDFRKTPSITLRELAKTLFTSRNNVIKTIRVCASLGLFNHSKWHNFAVLSSPMLAASQDEYSKKQERGRERVRTLSGQTPEKAPLEQDIEQEVEEERKEIQKQIKNEKDLVVLKKGALTGEKLSTSEAQNPLVPPVSDDDIKQFRRQIWEDIQAWNEGRTGRFDWIPSDNEICRLLRGGDPEHKLRLCYQAMNLLGGDSSYPQVVRRAVRMMLESSRRKRVTNPFGWLWTCLHGNAGGTPPWVQLATAAEES